jgi:hypothetical protein
MADNIQIKDALGASKTMRTTDTSGADLHVPIHRLDGLTITGTAGLSALNTDLLSNTVNGWVDVSAWASGAIMIIASAGITAGGVFFEQTNDASNTAGIPLEVRELGSVSTNPLVAGITISASTRRAFSFGVLCRYIRARVSSAFVGGTVQAIAQMASIPYSAPVMNVQQGNGALLGTINLDNVWFQESVTAQAANATVTGTSRQTNSASSAGCQFSKFNAYAFSDVAGGVFRIEVSADSTTWRRATADTAVAANTGVFLTIPVVARYARAVFVNGANAQAAFLLTTSYTAG